MVLQENNLVVVVRTEKFSHAHRAPLRKEAIIFAPNTRICKQSSRQKGFSAGT